MTIKIKLHKGVDVPAYATSGSAAVDLIANVKAPFTILPGDVAKIPTGVFLDMTEHPGVCALVMSRSGLGTKGLVLANTIGLIDNDYQGEILVMAMNRNVAKQKGMGTAPADRITITPGMRLAQLMFTRFEPVEFETVKEFAEATDRGEGGLGSTGS